MGKKGSLNLSIEAIVIIVIAFVVLGLGLGFVRGIFEQGTGLTEDALSAAGDSIKDSLQKSNDPLYFPKDTLTIGAGKQSFEALGIKNVGDLSDDFSVEFYVRVGGNFMPFTPEVIKKFGEGDAAFTASVNWDNSPQHLDQGTFKAIPFGITGPSKFGDYLYKIKIVRSDGSEYVSKTLFVRTS